MKAGENMGIMTTLKKPTAESLPPPTSPVWHPRCTAKCTPCSCPRRVLSCPTASTIPRPARTARWASSSCAKGYPK